MARLRPEGGPDGTVRAVRVEGCGGTTVYLGGSCQRWGCSHSFTEHQGGAPTGVGAIIGGPCSGTRQRFGNGPDTPCECTRYQDRYHG